MPVGIIRGITPLIGCDHQVQVDVVSLNWPGAVASMITPVTGCDHQIQVDVVSLNWPGAVASMITPVMGLRLIKLGSAYALMQFGGQASVVVTMWRPLAMEYEGVIFRTLRLLNLSTVDPLVFGAVWNDDGTLKISAGV